MKSRVFIGVLSLFLSFLSPCVNAYASQAAEASEVFGAEVRDSVLHIPGGTRRIADSAFRDRRDFHSVVFDSPVSIEDFGDYCFHGCSNLLEIAVPASVRSLGTAAFRECTSLRSVTLPSGIRKLPKACFAFCESLEGIGLPRRLADIGSHAFAFCRSLREVSIPAGVAHIGSNAFCFCESLTEVFLPSSVTELESYAFAECTSLRRVTLPANPGLLGELMFTGCRSLEEIVEMSPVPPAFDCRSTIFDNEEGGLYSRCRLRVPASAIHKYRKAPGWELFHNTSD